MASGAPTGVTMIPRHTFPLWSFEGGPKFSEPLHQRVPSLIHWATDGCFKHIRIDPQTPTPHTGDLYWLLIPLWNATPDGETIWNPTDSR